MVSFGGRLLAISAQRRECAGVERPAVVAEEFAVSDLVGADLPSFAIQDIEYHDRAVAIRQGHGAASDRDASLSIVLGELEFITNDFEVSRRRCIAGGERRA